MSTGFKYNRTHFLCAVCSAVNIVSRLHRVCGNLLIGWRTDQSHAALIDMQVTGEGNAVNIPEHKQDGDGMDCDITMPLQGNHLSGGVGVRSQILPTN